MSGIRTAVAVGDRSPIGQAVLEHALERFEVAAVIFPTRDTYERFLRSPLPMWRRVGSRVKHLIRGAPERFPGERRGERLSWDAITERWEPNAFDLLLSGGFPAIFPDRILAIGERRVNVHTSLLPQLKGRHPHYWAVEWGLERSGLTAHEMTADVDEGEIVGQVVIDIPAGTTYERHYGDLRAAVPALLDQVQRWIATGERAQPVAVEPSWSPGEPEGPATATVARRPRIGISSE